MNSELEKLIEKYRITVNGLADLEGDYDKVIKERGFVTLNGLLADGTAPVESSETAPAVPSDGTAAVAETTPNPEPTPVVPSEPTPAVPSDGTAPGGEPTPVVPAPSEPASPAPTVENPGVTPVPSEPAVSDNTNLGTEVASGERSAEPVTDTEESSEENSSEEEGEPAAGGKPKKKKK